MIAIELTKELPLNDDPKTIQQINFTGNLEQAATIFFITEKAIETFLDFSQGIVIVFSNFRVVIITTRLFFRDIYK